MKTLSKWFPVGTRSILFGVHCWFIHPWFVALAWWRLYGFPLDIRLWVAFFVHDLGYWGKPNMDGPEGETHPEKGARIMHLLFDPVIWVNAGSRRYEMAGDTTWRDFCLYHSRFYAKRDGKQFSRLCVADKLAAAIEPWWLYLPRAWLSGELTEYRSYLGGKGDEFVCKYQGERFSSRVREALAGGTCRSWHQGMTLYMREWVEEHKDGREDTWTTAPAVK